MNVRFGILGLGQISTRFATVLNTVEGVELAAVAARDAEKAARFARDFGASKACRDYLELIRDPDVDIVYIGLTTNLHYEYTRLCLENHKAVLCEKPLVTTRAQAEELAALAEKNQTLLMEAMWTRCLPAFQQARQWVKAGRIGAVRLITANFCFNLGFYDPAARFYDPNLAGGSLFDVGVYLLDFASGVLDEYPQQVQGLARLTPSRVDAAASLSLSFPGGALASLNCAMDVQAGEEAAIYGSTGRIVLENCYGLKTCSLYNDQGILLERFEDHEPDGFAHQVRHAADQFRRGEIQSNLIPWQDSIQCAGYFDLLRQQWGLI